jgi:hypothetical protein
MEFMNRSNGQPQPPANLPSNANARPGQANKPEKGSNRNDVKLLRYMYVALLFSITILIVVVAWSLVLGKPKSESNFVENNRMQAVFLNGGQVYFGKIRDLNDKYLRLTDIFYLRVNQTIQPKDQSSTKNNENSEQNDITIVKLGCELHRPSNEMLINRDQVIFWENLRNEDGDNNVPGAVKKYLEQFPNGQKCEEQTAQSNTDKSSETKNDNNN